VNIEIHDSQSESAKAAATQAALAIRNAIRDRGQARIIAATGNSQLQFLDVLIGSASIDWGHVEMFHLDEYVGMPASHPASFRKYLLERFIQKAGITRYHLLDGDGDPVEVAGRVGAEINAAPIDVAFVGIGENGHLAFNDPPADFQTETPFLVVELDDACRRQQVQEGWFANISEVPTHAISMSIRQILKARDIIAMVPEARKAKAVKACLEGAISPEAPASALQKHPNVTVYLDPQSSALLSADFLRRQLVQRE
jgi:glucosamine-6-phosphate deaminase